MAMGMLPSNTVSGARLALMGVCVYDAFQKELRTGIRFLEQHGGLSGPGAHLVHETVSPPGAGPSIGPGQQEGEQSAPDDGLPLLLAGMQRAGLSDYKILAAARGYRSGGALAPKKSATAQARANTPP